MCLHLVVPQFLEVFVLVLGWLQFVEAFKRMLRELGVDISEDAPSTMPLFKQHLLALLVRIACRMRDERNRIWREQVFAVHGCAQEVHDGFGCAFAREVGSQDDAFGGKAAQLACPFLSCGPGVYT